MALLSASLQACLEEAAAEVTRRVETNDVVRDMVAAVVTFHAEGVCDELRAALAAVERRNASLQGDIDQLQAQKGAADAELQRIKVEAEALRDALMRDVGHILYESKSLEKHHERIRELEGRVLELSQRPVAPAPAPATVSGGDEPCVAEAPSLPPSTPMTHVTRSPSPLPLLPPSLPPTLPPSLPPSTPTVASSNGAAASNGHTAPPAPPLVAPTPAPSLVALDDRAWLLVASFLTRADVVQAARANRRLFARLDVLLGMGSAVDTTGWGPPADPAEPAAAAAPALSTPAPSNSSSSSSSSTSSKPKFWPFAAADAVLPASLAANVFNAVGAGIGAIGAARDRSSSGSAAKAPGNGVATTPIGVASPLPSLSLSPAPMNGGDVLSRDMADSMAKKLSSAELRAVIGLTEMLKTKTTELEASRADNEDVVSRLQSVVTMRDFLIEKLKSAEVALKAVMIENAALRRQAVADHEVINFLDLRGQEADCKNKELEARVEQLQTAYNLQCGTHSYTERQLSADLAAAQEKCRRLEDGARRDTAELRGELRRLRDELSAAASERALHAQQLKAVKQILQSPG